MDGIIDPLICVLAGLMVLVLLRWLWLRRERRRLTKISSRYDTERFNPDVCDDEDDKTYAGRVIKRLRSRLIEGRVEIHWEYNAPFIHRGFVLTAKSRRNDGDWQPLALEPYQDSGSWIECFNYGESRSYLFTVKKAYRFFFGLFGEQPDEIVYDQISFSVRKGKFLKEKKELIQDRTALLSEVKEYVRAEQDIRKMMNVRPESTASLPKEETMVDRLEKRRKARSELADYIDQKTAEINAHSNWSEERKRREVEHLQQIVEEAQLDS